MSSTPPPPPPKPKTYLLTSSISPLGHALSLHLLSTGASVAACCTRRDLDSPLFAPLRAAAAPFPSRLSILELDPLSPGTCQATIAVAIATFSRLDVVIHTGIPTYVGALEELGKAEIAAQFEAGYFGRVNVVKAALTAMRRQRGGHVMVVTGITGAMGTPALGLRCAADHAIEGLLDALAYEVAPFGIRVTVVQPSVEAAVFGGGEVLVAKEMEVYRDLPGGGQVRAVRRIAELGREGRAVGELLGDTVRIIAEVAGLENPPGRVTVGEEGVEMVKERLKTLSEELEEHLETSLGVDANEPV